MNERDVGMGEDFVRVCRAEIESCLHDRVERRFEPGRADADEFRVEPFGAVVERQVHMSAGMHPSDIPIADDPNAETRFSHTSPSPGLAVVGKTRATGREPIALVLRAQPSS